ncbi:hypothetical protein FOL47_002728 [Perkinsus chesapeaki]|uniref:Uncharacterized protein n=1 Tax=Perkinsus chesapeaki TaxID=330153 RepID=A0A7J6MBW7_PERCH|nr:hypothetical protein FOL47_002728 [Perkinsus chesapeaki]
MSELTKEDSVWRRARQLLDRLDDTDSHDPGQGDLLTASADIMRSLVQDHDRKPASLLHIVCAQKERISALEAMQGCLPGQQHYVPIQTALEGSSISSVQQAYGDPQVIRELQCQLGEARKEAGLLREQIQKIRKNKEEEIRFGLDVARTLAKEEGSLSLVPTDGLLTPRLFARQRTLLVSVIKAAHELRDDNVKLSLQLSQARASLKGLERLGGEAAIKALTAALESRDRQLAEKDARIANLCGRLASTANRSSVRSPVSDSESSVLSDKTTLEGSEAEKAILVDTQETGMFASSTVELSGPVAGNASTTGKVGYGTSCGGQLIGQTEVDRDESAAEKSETSESPVRAPSLRISKGPRQHVSRTMAPPPAPLLIGRDIQEAAEMSIEAIEAAATVRNSTVMQADTETEEDHVRRPPPQPNTVDVLDPPMAVSTPGRVSDVTRLSLSATTFNGVRRRPAGNVPSSRLDFSASARPSTETEVPNTTGGHCPTVGPPSVDLLRAWRPNSGGLSGQESPVMWAPQPAMVQRRYSANTYTAGGQRRLIARQLSGTPILAASEAVQRRDTPNGHCGPAGLVRQSPSPPSLTSLIPRPPHFINLGSLSHRSTMGSSSTAPSSRQSSTAQFVPIIGSPVPSAPSFLSGLSSSPDGGGASATPGGMRMVSNTPIPQLALHKAYTPGLPVWSTAGGGGPTSARGNSTSVFGPSVLRSARVLAAHCLQGRGGLETDAALRSLQILVDNFNRLGPSLACDLIHRISMVDSRREDLPRICKKFINVTSAELPFHIDLVPAPDAIKAVEGFWELGHRAVAKRLLTNLQTSWLEPLTEKVQRTPFRTPHRQYGDLYKRRGQAEDTLVLSCPVLSQMHSNELKALWRIVDSIVAEAGDEPVPEGTVEILRHELHPLRRVLQKCLTDRERMAVPCSSVSA